MIIFTKSTLFFAQLFLYSVAVKELHCAENATLMRNVGGYIFSQRKGQK